MRIGALYHFAALSLLTACGDETVVKVEESPLEEEMADVDGDSYSELEDCDDENDAVNPGAVEICDGVDNDCDNLIDDEDETLRALCKSHISIPVYLPCPPTP